MNRIQFWSFALSSSFVGILFLGEIVANRQFQSADHELVGIKLLIQQGQESHNLWQQLAYRTYLAGQKDPGLLNVLKREQINVTPRSSAVPAKATP